jgi:transcriptional regulator with XRE-family HTH domain
MAKTPSTGKLIIALRDKKKLNQKAFAKRLGISAANLCRLENDQQAVSAPLMRKFMRMGLSAADLLREPPSRTKAA